jgi:hypothetical protein
MRGRLLFCLIFVVGLTLVLFVKHWTDMRGLPAIEASVDKQLGVLVSQSPNLKGLVVGSRGRVRMAGDTPPFKGEIQYQAHLNGSSVDLFVSWTGDSTSCQITKIESGSGNAELKIIWEQQH